MQRRKSPKRHIVWNVFDELVSIPTLLDHPNLELHLLMIEETEVRSGKDLVARGRRGRVVDRRLETVLEQRVFREPGELLEVLPPTLEQPFTTADLSHEAGIARQLAQKACYVLRHAALITEVGRDRAGVHYRR